MPVPVVSRRLHQPFDLALGEVLAGPIFDIRQPTASDCSLLVVGALARDLEFIGNFPYARSLLFLGPGPETLLRPQRACRQRGAVDQDQSRQELVRLSAPLRTGDTSVDGSWKPGDFEEVR